MPADRVPAQSGFPPKSSMYGDSVRDANPFVLSSRIAFLFSSGCMKKRKCSFGSTFLNASTLLDTRGSIVSNPALRAPGSTASTFAAGGGGTDGAGRGAGSGGGGGAGDR